MYMHKPTSSLIKTKLYFPYTSIFQCPSRTYTHTPCFHTASFVPGAYTHSLISSKAQTFIHLYGMNPWPLLGYPCVVRTYAPSSSVSPRLDDTTKNRKATPSPVLYSHPTKPLLALPSPPVPTTRSRNTEPFSSQSTLAYSFFKQPNFSSSRRPSHEARPSRCSSSFIPSSSDTLRAKRQNTCVPRSPFPSQSLKIKIDHLVDQERLYKAIRSRNAGP